MGYPQDPSIKCPLVKLCQTYFIFKILQADCVYAFVNKTKKKFKLIYPNKSHILLPLVGVFVMQLYLSWILSKQDLLKQINM